MYNLPFDKPGRFYRGNLHCHSTASDGHLDPAALVAAYRDRDYDFVALTDHFWAYGGAGVTDTRLMRTDAFTTLLGAELHAPQLGNGAEWHLVAVGLPLDFAPSSPSEPGPMLAARAAEAGAFVGIAHPAWASMTLDDALTIEAAHAVEVRNGTVGLHQGRGDGWYMSDLLAHAGRRLTAYAADDAHFKEPADCFGAWVMVRAEKLDPDALLAALKAGHYYATEGPELRDIWVCEGELRVSCSPAANIIVTGRGKAARYAMSAGITEYTFPLEPFADAYCRVTVVDEAGKRAWSNLVWLT